MAATADSLISVLDFRRQRMCVRWNTDMGSWQAHEDLPARVRGVAYIRPQEPNLCVFAQNGKMKLQIGRDQYLLHETSPQIKCERDFFSFGYRRRFSVRSATGALLFETNYWVGSDPDFFQMLAHKAADADWRAINARIWSDGVESAQLRANWSLP